MPVIRINADNDRPVLHGVARPFSAPLGRALAGGGPIVVMVHGYSFLPHDPLNCPHTHIFSMGDTHSCPKALSWPRNLGFGQGISDEGLAIAFGWNARGSLWAARETSDMAARALVDLIRQIRNIAPDRAVHIIAHSLGAHLALSAMQGLAAGDLGRVIVLNGATYQSHAHSALISPAGKTTELFNIISRENAPVDFMFERLIAAAGPNDHTMGHGFEAQNALTLRLENQDILSALASLGFPIAARRYWCCHWSTYLRPGVFPLYQTLLRAPEHLSLKHLQILLDQNNVPPDSHKMETPHAWPLLRPRKHAS